MVQCYLCKGKLRVTRDKHVYDEKLKKRYHFKCFAGICRVCDMPVYSKAPHKTIGTNVWHERCYKRAHRHNPVKTIDDISWKAMVAARKAAGVPKKLWREFEETYFKEHPPEFEEGRDNPEYTRSQQASRRKFIQLTTDLKPDEEVLWDGKTWKKYKRKNPRRPTKEFWDKTYPGVLAGYKKKYPKKEAEERARKTTASIWYDKMSPKKKARYERIRTKRESRENPTLVTPEAESDIVAAFRRVIQGVGTEADKVLVRMAREADVVMSTGPSVMFKRNPKTWLTVYICPVHGQVPSTEVAGPEFGPKRHYPINGTCEKVVEETEKQAVRGEEGETLYINPKKLDYIIQDEFGKVYETGSGTQEEAETRALVFNRKFMREFKVIYPKTESPEVKKAAQSATREMLKD